MAESVPAGGEFLVLETRASDIFIPEEFDEEQRMIVQTCREFLAREVYPRLEEIDRQDEGLMESLLKKAGELGLLGIMLPEEYGGFGKGFNTGLLVGAAVGASHSFAVAFLAHTGIGTLPILYYGSDVQKEKYLPKLASGEQLACYCLTEPEAGSDAGAGKTRATGSYDEPAEGPDEPADGPVNDVTVRSGYRLNGQKMWITNGGFADIFIVFCKIDDDQDLSAFIVERNFGGITMNPEERKMGIKGSSTRQIFFNDCPVPAENQLWERGRGFKMAVNILNTGRAKLCAAAVGACQETIFKSLKYATERIQFGVPIAQFGAIRYKLAEMATRTFAVESALYRTGGYIEDAFNQYRQEGMPDHEARLKSTERFAVECAILKVYGSECLDYVVDEAVQLFGGMGYSAEGPVERAYRDARINRIFEGTNEINRLLTVDMLLKRAMKGQPDLLSAAQEVARELTSLPAPPPVSSDDPLASEKLLLANLKKAVLMVAGAAVRHFGQQLEQEQELIMNIADMVSIVYISESALLRAEKLRRRDKAGETTSVADTGPDMARVYLYSATDRIWLAGKEAIQSFAEGDTLKGMLLGLKRFTKAAPFNTTAARRRIAASMLK